MKRFILFLFVLFFPFSVHIKAQTIGPPNIDSLVISEYIECPGETGCIEVWISQSNPPTDYIIVLQEADAVMSFWTTETIGPTQATYHEFCGLSAGFFRILLVDPALAPPYPVDFNYPQNSLIYDDAVMALVEPDDLVIVPSDLGLNCWDDDTASLQVILSEYTQPYIVWLYDDLGNLLQDSTYLPYGDTSYTFTGLGLTAGTYEICGTDSFRCPVICENHEINKHQHKHIELFCRRRLNKSKYINKYDIFMKHIENHGKCYKRRHQLLPQALEKIKI